MLSGTATWLLSQVAMADDWLSLRKARRRIQPVCSIPPEDYQYGARTPSTIVRSLPAVPQLSAQDIQQTLELIRSYSGSIAAIEAASMPDATIDQLAHRADLALSRRLEAQQALQHAQRPKAKLMQLATRQLTIAHCSISDVAFQIQPSGAWHLSLRGDQNYLRDDRQRERNVDLQIKRNAFKLNVRLLRSSRSGGENQAPLVLDEQSVDQAGKLAIVEIDVAEFWVQREAPQRITRLGYHPLIASHYDDIDQAEFEFFVRLDPLTGSGTGVVQPWQREP